MTKRFPNRESQLWQCMICGSTNEGTSPRCFQCGHPGPFSQHSRQRRLSLSSTRRNVLIGGLVAGAAFLGGGAIWFVRRVFPGGTRSIAPLLEVQLDPGYLPSPALAWSPDGLRLACSAVFDEHEHEGVIIVDVKTGLKTWTHWDPSSDLSALAWSPDGKLLSLAGRAFSGKSSPGPFVQLWQVQGWQQGAEYPGASSHSSEEVSFQQLAWSPDGSRLAVALFNEAINARSLQIWSMSDGRILFTRQMPAALNLIPFMLCWLPDSKTLATSELEGEVDIWDTDTGESLFHQVPAHPLEDDPLDPLLSAGPGAAMSPDRKQLALYTLEHGQPIIQVWDIAAKKLLFRCQSVTGQQGGLTWSPDGKYLAALTNDHGQNTIHLWDSGSGALSLTCGVLYGPGALIWSPDGRLLALVDRRQPFFMRGPARDTVLRVFAVE